MKIKYKLFFSVIKEKKKNLLGIGKLLGVNCVYLNLLCPHSLEHFLYVKGKIRNNLNVYQ